MNKFFEILRQYQVVQHMCNWNIQKKLKDKEEENI